MTATSTGRGAAGFLLALSVVGLAGCGNSAPAPSAADPTPLVTPGAGITISPELLGPLPMLGPCPEVDDPGLDDVVPGLELPDDAFLLEVKEVGGLTQVRGYAPLTPILLQLDFREREDLEMVSVEHEIQESETLYSDGTHRVFLKAAAICELGSLFVATIATEADADAVPTPTGTPTP